MRTCLTWAAAISFTAAVCLAYAGGKDAHTTRLVSVNSVSASGPVVVFLKYKHLRNGRIHVSSSDKKWVTARVHGRVLEITSTQQPAGTPSKVFVTLPKPLVALSAVGQAQVIGRGVVGNDLAVTAADLSEIDLQGTLSVSEIKTSDHSQVRLDWVRGKTVNVNTDGQSSVYISGKVRRLAARLAGHATLYGQYLQAATAFADAAGSATIYLSPRRNLRAFAKEDSEIIYFSRPLAKTERAKQHANIMHMGWDDAWASPQLVFGRPS